MGKKLTENPREVFPEEIVNAHDNGIPWPDFFGGPLTIIDEPLMRRATQTLLNAGTEVVLDSSEQPSHDINLVNPEGDN